MKKTILFVIALNLISLPLPAAIHTCPSPQTSSLSWGEIPIPWKPSPFSPCFQAEEGMKFLKANILVAGLGRGVVCSYQNSIATYAIWWPVRIKIPAREDYNWINTNGGFVCTGSIGDCQFSVAEEF